jgi:DNA-binding transcriptional LysR family regulator
MFEDYSLDQLTVFLAVVDEGSFSAAGRRVGRVQSAVSHAIGTLEDALGVQLFDRSRRRPQLTAAGERLASEARLLLAQARELRQVARTLEGGLESEVVLAVDPLYPPSRLSEVFRRFSDAHPTVSMRVISALLEDAVALVRSGEVDLGVCNVGPAHDDLLESRPTGSVQLIPVCAAGHRLAAAAAPQRAALLRRATQVVLTERSQATQDQGVIGATTWRVTDLETKLALIRAGVGWGSAPVERVASDLESGRLVRLHPEPWPRGGHQIELHTLVRSDRPLGPAATWLREALALPD